MTPKLSDATRSVWTDAYSLHEKYAEMKGSDTDWCKFANEVTLTVAKHQNPSDRRLCELILLALYDFMSEEQKKRESAAREQPEQVTINEVIPWT